MNITDDNIVLYDCNNWETNIDFGPLNLDYGYIYLCETQFSYRPFLGLANYLLSISYLYLVLQHQIISPLFYQI